MTKSPYLVVITIVLSLLVFGVVFAGFDDEGNPNDPRINERANACYEGGTLEGKCSTEAEWQAGWYLIRYQNGMINRQGIPEWAQWVLQEEPGIFGTTTPTPFPTTTPLPP
ncbi:MAG: hypothetical protein RLP44_03840 [Aggregatilineales bacterium]